MTRETQATVGEQAQTRNTISRRSVVAGITVSAVVATSGCSGVITPPAIENVQVRVVDIRSPSVGATSLTLPFIFQFQNRGDSSIPDVSLSADVYVNDEQAGTAETFAGSLDAREQTRSRTNVIIDYASVGTSVIEAFKGGDFNVRLDAVLQSDGLLMDAERRLRFRNNSDQQAEQSGGSNDGESSNDNDDGEGNEGGDASQEGSSRTHTLEAQKINGNPTLDGSISSSEWDAAKKHTLTFQNFSRERQAETPVYLAHNGAFLLVAIDSAFKDGWDSHATVNIDGNFNGQKDGNKQNPYVDVRVGAPAPNGWPGYNRYQILGAEGSKVEPSSAKRTSGIGPDGTVHFEFAVPFNSLDVSPGDSIGVLLRTHTPEHGKNERYYWPSPPNALSGPEEWAELKIK